jgi:pimeloyl-ACP methyl ester carboxylesterase
VGLPTYVQDIVNVLVYEDLHDVILVGKSGSGIAITGVAEQTPERIACLVYLNAFVPEDGQSLAGLVGPEVTQQMESRARAYDGWRVPPQPGIDPRISPQPLRLFTDRVRLQNPAAARLPRAYIWGTAHPETPIYAPLRRVAAQARVGGWIYRELPSGHEPERQMPEELSRVLLEVTAEVEKGHQ